MDSRFKHPIETRIAADRLFDAGFGYRSVSAEVNISVQTARHWQNKHRQGQLLRLGVVSNKYYSSDVKRAAVEAFLSGTSKSAVLIEFGISATSVLNRWVAEYRRSGEEGFSPKKRGRPPKVSRSETLEEENKRLRMENTILKKWVALAEEEDRRLSGR